MTLLFVFKQEKDHCKSKQLFSTIRNKVNQCYFSLGILHIANYILTTTWKVALRTRLWGPGAQVHWSGATKGRCYQLPALLTQFMCCGTVPSECGYSLRFGHSQLLAHLPLWSKTALSAPWQQLGFKITLQISLQV